MIRVAVVASSESAGGAEEYIYRLYGELVSSGHVEVILIGRLPNWPKTLGQVHQSGATNKLTRRKPIFPQVVRSARSVPEIIREIRRVAPDIVHVQYMKEKFTLPHFIRRDAPIIWTEHGPLPDNLPYGSERLLAWQAKLAAVIAVSPGVEESLSVSGISSIVIPNPLPDALGTSSHYGTASADRVDRREVVTYAGRLHESKRIDLVLEAAALLPDVDFVIAGDGPAREQLVRRADVNVSFVGRVSDMTPIYAQSDAVIIPSGRAAREGSPMAMLEARSEGVPVIIAEDCHAYKEAMELGCSGFSPSGANLRDAIVDALGCGRIPLPNDVLEERSISSWANRHLQLMLEVLAAAKRDASVNLSMMNCEGPR
ncbi:glycosyltransferase family 4 protein [Rhodococcus wratislaviensis]|uniref:glycosyltransferase family 4 protein n=1 Tax=Rhodococcus wratislaviensis TaxID=44752 RepID=UPI0036556118